MRIKNKNQTGITLTELLVASVIVGIIMIGIVSVDYATRQAQVKTSNASALATEAGAAMFDIMRNINLAIGDGTGQDGIVIIGTDNTICARQDQTSGGTVNNTPADYTDDTWKCFSESGTDLVSCNKASPEACTKGVYSNSRIIGKVVSGTFNPQFVNNGIDLYIQISITSRVDPAAAANPTTNPQYTLTSHSSPIAQGGPGSQL